ncbi:MAG: glycosyltransferase, partial [Hyphomicrobiaceae bacterium]
VPLVPVDTFAVHRGAVTRAWRIPLLRRQIALEVGARGISDVVELMPHVWSRAVMPSVKSAGARYHVVAHDVSAHPGDIFGRAQSLLTATYPIAHRVIALSEVVARDLVETSRLPRDRIVGLFHPDLGYDVQQATAQRPSDAPLRLLFLGRIMPYKGLGLFVETLEELRSRGFAFEAGVFGAGDLGGTEARLQSLGAEVVNRWLGDDEIAGLLGRFDAVVLSHIEASQSGVAAAGFGAGLPVVATPVGGLAGQVRDGVTGTVAARVDAAALADAIERLGRNYAELRANVALGRDQRSMRRFVRDLVAALKA